MTTRFSSIKSRIAAGIAVAILVAGLLFFVFSPASETPAPLPPAPAAPSGFAFFGVGQKTLFSDNIEKALTDRLGSGVLERRGTIDLIDGEQGFLSKNFPEIDALHKKLNDSSGARIEHDVIKLSYRYALKKNTPFSYVHLVFSNESKRPLFFRISAKKEAAAIIDEMKTKYGTPRQFTDSERGRYALSWQKDNDLFIIFENKDRFGDPEFLFMIYFRQNIKALIAAETRQHTQREEARKNAVRKAF